MDDKRSPQRYKHPLSQLFETFWDDENDLFRPWRGTQQRGISLSEDDAHIYVETALPGVDEDKIEVTLDHGILTVRGQREEKEDGKKYIYRSSNQFAYQVALPESVDETKEPKANYEKGVLSISFDKSKQRQPRKINISSKRK
ncbi:MAG: hypothetical protein A3F09_02615 [Chlamydiae bacterium RIFCSPHIGHO2_12_FULL_49_11]|nr:MAG: hypothetical protein A3F09_02615 [Chlamydiae bacterium RIFCSPHIGHO2_12_FULL_49_11]